MPSYQVYICIKVYMFKPDFYKVIVHNCYLIHFPFLLLRLLSETFVTIHTPTYKHHMETTAVSNFVCQGTYLPGITSNCTRKELINCTK